MGPFGLVGVSTTSLEGAHLVVVDLVVHLVAQRVGNFSDRPWGFSVILVSELGVDESLEQHRDAVSDDVDVAAGTNHIEQVVEVRI